MQRPNNEEDGGFGDGKTDANNHYHHHHPHLIDFAEKPSVIDYECGSFGPYPVDELHVGLQPDINGSLDGIKSSPDVERAVLNVRFIAQHMENLDNFTDWSAKLNDNNTVFQAELTALHEAVIYASHLPNHNTSKIHVDNRASIMASSNSKSTTETARKIFKILLSNPRIKVSWVKPHAGNIGNERADQRNMGNPIHILSFLNRT
ncbi:hypothetical protein AVEN_188356-1 [Araneus ventricosus]|uniref:RNase H type-1 domain-containing protein n=1 Tax=Araneus ventricosus TaxID=182803 RepID=A0A4Y2UY81_ARAVE|nr:hypothetical protein AVEN_98547-1 [Araneus ventricosus]GBO17233.1 hypothetical protein AVEN_188356-1 [Araneus ventricosus]